MATDVETPEDAPSPVEFWRGQIDIAIREERGFVEDGEIVIRRYRGLELSDYETGESSPITKFNVLWSNTETLKPAVYSSVPKPDVRVRNFPMNLNDPIQKQRAETAQEAATCLEKCLSTTIDDGHFDAVLKQCRDDVLLPGRGVIRARYVVEWEDVTALPVFGEMMEGDEDVPIIGYQYEGDPIEPERDDDGNAIERDGGFMARVKADEAVKAEYVFWASYKQQPARTWADTGWIAFEHFMEYDDLVEAFGKATADKIPLEARRRLGTSNDGMDDESRPPDKGIKVARLWEIFDQREMEQVWIADGYDHLVEKSEDPLNLTDFYPSPKPLTFYTTTDNTIPMSEYRFYRDQATELDVVNGRITRLIYILKATGGYNAKIDKIVDIHQQADGELAPIEFGDEFRDEGGLSQNIWMWPLDAIAQTLAGLYNQRMQLLQQIYELTGISDLIRGHTRATETLGAQQMKASFGSMRMENRRQPMNEFVRDTLRIMGELIGENFEKSTLEAMSGMTLSDEAVAMLRTDRLRYFNVDIESDSTVTPDAEMQKQEAAEFARAITEYINATAPIVSQNPALGPFFVDLMKVVFRRFKMSREMEAQFDELSDMMKQQTAQAGVQPGMLPGVNPGVGGPPLTVVPQ